MIKYRTDIMFSFLDLLVAFGGIAGLFVGSSILSLIEVFYFSSIGLFFELKRRRQIIHIEKTKFPFAE